MTNPLDFLIKDPDAMRYELMRAQTPGMKTGGRAVGGVAGEQEEVRTPPGGPMKNLTWENYRHAIGMRVGGYAEGGQVTGYGSEVPQLDSRGEVIRAQPTPEQIRYLESINNPSIADQAAGFGEAGMSFLTGIPAQLAGAVGYGVGKLTGRDPEALGAEWERSLQYQPTTPMGEVRTEQMSKVLNALDPLYGFAGHAGHAAATPNVAEMRAGLRMAGEQAVEAARPLHEAYMAGEVPGVVNPAANVVKPEGNLNFTPFAAVENLKGPDIQTVGSFVNQIKGKPGVTAAGLEEGLAKLQYIDPEAKVSKEWFESQITPSKFEKVDLRGAASSDIEHYIDLAYDHVSPEDTFRWIGAPDSLLSQLDEVYQGDIGFNEASPAVRKWIESSGGIDNFRDNVEEAHSNLIHDRALQLRADDAEIIDGSGYSQAQRLIEPDFTESETPGSPGSYFELGVAHPGYTKSYRHYDSAPQGTVGHIRGSFLPEPYMDDAVSIGVGDRSVRVNDPGAMLIEEIQSDANKVDE